MSRRKFQKMKVTNPKSTTISKPSTTNTNNLSTDPNLNTSSSSSSFLRKRLQFLHWFTFVCKIFIFVCLIFWLVELLGQIFVRSMSNEWLRLRESLINERYANNPLLYDIRFYRLTTTTGGGDNLSDPKYEK